MTDIVNINEMRAARRRYRRCVHDAARSLRMYQEQLTELATAIAFTGPLRAELAAKPIGAIFHVDEGVLSGTGDPRVMALIRVSETIDEAVAALYAEPMVK
jgi:hypothetical protein